MSSRALRRLQREEEERKQREASQLQPEGESIEDEENEEEEFSAARPQKNAFDFLNDAEEDDEDESMEDEPGGASSTNPVTTEAAPSTSRKSKKKPKKKKKKTNKVDTPEPESKEELDEIDRILQSLNTADGAGKAAVQGPDPALRSFYDLLSTDSKHLNPLNEMKKLFGSSVLGSPDGEGNRRRARGTHHLDLGASLTARHMTRGQSLAGLALRRNVFMLGKEDWPKGTSGGLGMELEEEAEDFTIEYKFVHSSMYQSTQRQFDLCVESMDPQRMISHLHLNPYHIATLLQVSEIAKHQGDHAVAVDLLERALFTFGRSIHSSFAASMASGKARLDFRRPENREFWLAAYRYIGTLGQRGTWRTAYEWAKLLLSLDPEQDPYCLRLIIDQMALRGAQFESLVRLAETSIDLVDWGQQLANVQISLSMAYYKLKRLPEAQETLRRVAKEHPWVLANLCRELNIEPIPPSVWGREPRTSREELAMLAYGLRAKDIWNTPEALSFLKSVLESLKRTEPPPPNTNSDDKDLSMSECRHIILAETPALMSVLPRSISSYRTSASDPLPPADDMPSYGTNSIEPTREEWEEEQDANQREAAGLQSWFTSLLRRLGVTIAPGSDERDEASVARVAAALESSGMDIHEIARRTSRMEELQELEGITTRRLLELEQGLQEINNMPDGEEEAEDVGDFIVQRPHTSPEERARLQAFAEEEIDEDAPGPSQAQINQSGQQQPLLRPATPPPPPVSIEETTASLPHPGGIYDDEANQRWLAGRGMLRLKDFVQQHGSDENKWKDDLTIDVTPATEYAHRVTLLKQRSSRDFILNYALRQGAGPAAGDLIRRLLA